MPPRKRPSSVLNGDARDQPEVSPEDAEVTSGPADALALAEEAEAEAEAAEAAAQAARARARAMKLRRQAKAAVAPAPVAPAPVTDHDVDTVAPALDEPVDESVEELIAEPLSTDESPADEDVVDEPRRRRRLRLPSIRQVAAAVVVLCTVAFLGASAFMLWHHRQVTEEQQRSAEFSAAARQGVVTLMSLNFNNAQDDVKRIIDDTTGDFKKDFQGQADQFTKAAQESKVITEATVNAIAVQSMAKDTATVLVAVTTQVSNTASKQQEPRSWRLRVDMARDGGQLKMAKVEFVP